jgi:2-methylcitrate dehydratase PrpD
MKVEERLAEYMASFKYEDIPATAIEATKAQILNILAAGIGGSAAGGIKELVGLLKDWGGKREGTILCYGDKLPAPHAAQANASMGHALDFDDTYNKIMIHPAVVTVPPALAIAEMRRGVNGKEFLAAVALAVDLGCRMGLVLNTPPGEKKQMRWQFWHFTALFGYFMAAAAAGRLLGLDREQMMNALGLAYHQASGNTQCVRNGAQAKRLGPGFSCRAGVASAIMAQKGITGATDFIEGEVGFYSLYHPQTYCDLNQLTQELGRRFENDDVSLKPYPCGVVNHTAIDAALAIGKEHDLVPEEVAEITVFTGEGSYFLCQPIESKRHPRNAVETQFSIPWSVGTAIAKKRASVWDYTQEAVGDPLTHKVTSKIKAEADPKLTRPSMIEPTRIRVKTTGGKEFMKQVDYPLGTPQKPFTRDDFRRKLKDCNSISIKPLPDEKLEELIETVGRLEEIGDVSRIMTLLAG